MFKTITENIQTPGIVILLLLSFIAAIELRDVYIERKKNKKDKK